MKYLMTSLRAVLLWTLICGLVYPVCVTLVGQALFPAEANGSLVVEQGKIVGSRLIAQNFEGEKFFWPRPSAISYNPFPSGGSNLAVTSSALMQSFSERQKKLGPGAPSAMWQASGSGLDPEIDLESALFQAPRVAKARGVPEEQIRSKVMDQLQKREWGFLGEERVNVLLLNLALDEKGHGS